MPLSTSDLVQMAIVVFFTTIFARYTSKILDNIEKKATQAKKSIKEKLNHD